MNLGELRDLVRTKLDDRVEPYLWSDSFLNESINRAQDEAIVRMGGIGDDYSPQFTQGIVPAGVPTFAIAPGILKIESVFVSTRNLIPTTGSYLTNISAGWELAVGTPTHFILVNSAIRLYPIPEVDTPISMAVKRGSLKPMTLDTHIPEVAYPLHHSLLHWVMAEAYSIPDSDINNPMSADIHYKAYDGIFGPVVSAKFLQAWMKTPARTAALMRRM